MPKYFVKAPKSVAAAVDDDGPNASCTNTPITPLTDVSTTAGQTSIKASIDAMSPDGATNVPEGMAWGWRVLSSGAPFTEGRPETEKGNDKVVIVLTDGANTYYTPSRSASAIQPTTSRPIRPTAMPENGTPSTTRHRAFSRARQRRQQDDYSNANYTKAMNEQFDTLCAQCQGGQRDGHDGIARP